MSRTCLIAVSALLWIPAFLTPSPAQEPRPVKADNPTNVERRLDALEKQLVDLHKELEQLHKDLLTKPPALAEKAEMRIYALKQGKAAEIAKVLQSIFGDSNKMLRIVADEKANSVIASAAPVDQLTIQALITELDSVTDKKKAAENAAGKPDWQVLGLKYADAVEMAQTLQSMFGDASKTVRCIPEPMTNVLLVMSPPEEMRKIQAVLAKLDVPSEKRDSGKNASGKPQVQILRLKRADANDLSALLLKLFPKEQYKSIRIAADARSNSLVVIAPTDDLATIQAIVERMEDAVEKKTDSVRPKP